jgi:hypothetical protein
MSTGQTIDRVTGAAIMVALSLTKPPLENITVKAANSSAAIQDEYARSGKADYTTV